MNTYNVTIETTEQSIDVAEFTTKRAAIDHAKYLRRHAQSWRGEFIPQVRPSVQVYNVTKEKAIYLQPFFISELKHLNK